MTYKIRDGVTLVLIQNVYLIVASSMCWDKCPYITQTNEMGVLIWNQLEEQKDLHDIVNRIMEEYETDDKKQIECDVHCFIQQMLSSHYLIQNDHDNKQ